MPSPQNPASNPLGPPTISGTSITVDTYLNPPSRIPAIIRNLVAQNEGYFAEDIFATPGFTVEGGAVLYEETFPEDFFLPADQSLAPRAPGGEAPLLGSTRRAPKIAQPESLAGTIEVHDEARRRNNVISVRRQFTQAANTFADRMQTRALAVLDAAVTAWSRDIAAVSGGWRQPRATGIAQSDPLTMPMADLQTAINQFIADKAGVRPDTLVINQNDWYYLTILYPNGQLRDLLNAYGLSERITPEAPEGAPYLVKRGQVGVIAFEKPLDQEYERIARRKTDTFTLEAVPVFVALDASAVVQITGVDADGS